METTTFRKILCANRGEIAIRVFRACTELEIRTVAIYSEEDRTHQHRYKADEAYLVGRGRSPIDAYLAIDEILEVARRGRVDAIHPGYGFLSENADFADACERAGIAFIGPRGDVLRMLGDKVRARQIAEQAGVPVIPALTLDLLDRESVPEAEAFFDKHAPVIVKAAHGGGGRGMRVVRERTQLRDAIQQASSEAATAFGSPVVFLEKYLPRVRHVEVQILGDLKGNIVHLYERDCSIQRRHQKIIEVAPAPNLNEVVRQRLHEDAVAIARSVGYHNAGTVEFLVGGTESYFIEVNPRLQVEHTVTEQVTGIDLVQAQILIAQGHSLGSEEIAIFGQNSIQPRGYAIQCRITTEDPANNFMPDTGRLQAFRSAAGFGIRLDTGNGYLGAHISPHYDSLLVKVTAHGLTYQRAIQKGLRALREFRIRGVKTNIPFLENVLQHDLFRGGNAYTSFIDESRELFQMDWRRDRGTKLLRYLGEVIVNGHPTIRKDQRCPPTSFVEPPIPIVPETRPPDGTVQILEERGPRGLADWVLQQDRPLLTDTTMRDAHQSLLATRVRTFDLLRIAHATAHLAPELFSLETWGGATFDVAYRFLDEDPWDRLRKLKRACPNLLMQMLLRGANAVGYTSYPDNLVERFIDEASVAGIDVFRVFDSLNDLDNMRVSVEWILKHTPKIAEVCICYTGDLANPARTKYTLDYYRDLAKRIEDMGAHILCIKDMAGLLRPRAAQMLIECLKETVQIPIHLHTHDTSGNGVAALLEAIRCGVDIVDVALAPMAGMTSQPSMNALVAAAARQPARDRHGQQAPTASRRLLGGRARVLRTVRMRAQERHVRGLLPRDPRRPVQQLAPAGRVHGTAGPLERRQARVCRRQPARRRHPEGDSQQQDGRRFRDLLGAERAVRQETRLRRNGRGDSPTRHRKRGLAGLSAERRELLPGAPRPAARGVPRRAAEGRTQRPSRHRGAAERQPETDRSRRVAARARAQARPQHPGSRRRQRRALPTRARRSPRVLEPARGRVGARHADVFLRVGARPGNQRRPRTGQDARHHPRCDQQSPTTAATARSTSRSTARGGRCASATPSARRPKTRGAKPTRTTPIRSAPRCPAPSSRCTARRAMTSARATPFSPSRR